MELTTKISLAAAIVVLYALGADATRVIGTVPAIVAVLGLERALASAGRWLGAWLVSEGIDDAEWLGVGVTLGARCIGVFTVLAPMLR
jgi:hypothetical protein